MMQTLNFGRSLMGGKRLYLVHGVARRLDAESRGAIERACAKHGFALAELTPGDPHPAVAPGSLDMVLLDADSMMSLAGEAGFAGDESFILCAFDPVIRPASEVRAESTQGFRYVLAMRPVDMIEPLLAAVLDYRVSGAGRGVGDHLLDTRHLVVQTERLSNSKERQRFPALVDGFVKRQMETLPQSFSAGTGSLGAHLATVLEELMMNAIWDANPALRNENRRKSVALPVPVEVKLFFDGRFLGLLVTDQHGSVPLSSMGKPVRYAIGLRDTLEVAENSAGAGLGLQMTLRQVNILTFTVSEGKLTRVSVFLRVDLSRKQTQGLPRSVMFFEQK